MQMIMIMIVVVVLVIMIMIVVMVEAVCCCLYFVPSSFVQWPGGCFLVLVGATETRISQLCFCNAQLSNKLDLFCCMFPKLSLLVAIQAICLASKEVTLMGHKEGMICWNLFSPLLTAVKLCVSTHPHLIHTNPLICMNSMLPSPFYSIILAITYLLQACTSKALFQHRDPQQQQKITSSTLPSRQSNSIVARMCSIIMPVAKSTPQSPNKNCCCCK